MNPLDLFITLGSDEATRQGVGPLVARERRRRGMDVPAELEAQERQIAATEILRERALDALFARFESERLPLLVFKGTALAYTLYEHPALRPRCDTDVVVRDADVSRARAILQQCGYAEEPSSGAVVSNAQRIFSRVDGFGVRHAIDLHWRTLNRPRLARSFEFEELWSRAISFRSLQSVRTPSTEDALLLAAAHLAGHHPGESRLIWLYDLHLLAAVADLPEVIRRARGKGIAREIAAALTSAACIDDRIPIGRQSRLREFVEDLRYTKGALRKLRFLRDHLLPDADHVLRKYGATSRALLPFLYLRRLLGLFGRSPLLSGSTQHPVVPDEKSKPAVRQGRKA